MKKFKEMTAGQKFWLISMLMLWAVGVPLSIYINEALVKSARLLPSSGRVHVYTWAMWMALGLYTLTAEWYINRPPKGE